MNIGERIRNRRKESKMTLEYLAKEVGISKMTLHRIETGKTSPSIACLADIAQALQEPITSFIDESRDFIKVIRKKDQFTFEGDKLKSRNIFPRGALSSLKGSNIAINYVEAEDGAEIEPHVNKGFEWVFQISGKAFLTYGDEEYVSKPGDVFFYNGRQKHSVRYRGKNKFLLLSFK